MKRHIRFLLYVTICLLWQTVTTAEGQEIKTRDEIILPKPRLKGAVSLEESIIRRRSVRSYEFKKLSPEQISQLLWAAQGITESERGLRAAPSAGALYPLEIYLVKEDGVFHYNPEDHSIEKKGARDVRSNIVISAWNQVFIQQAPVSIVICAVRSRAAKRYGARGDMYVDIEVGHVAQNIHLQAVALGLASVPVGAFDEGKVKDILDLPRDTEPVYIVPVGYGKD